MARTILLIGLVALTTACAATPLVTKSRMTLAEAGIKDMECRRETPTNSQIPKTTCAEPSLWAAWDKREAEKSERLIDIARDGNDNRRLYPQ